jgi:AcrR family transcriptional regulator
MAGKNETITSSPDAGDKTTKQRIFEVSLDLFAQKGFDAVSMREIAEAVGIKKASLYSHFASKDELVGQIFDYPTMALGDIGPKGADAEQMIVSMGVEGFMTMASDVFKRWIAAPGMEKVWRIICIEMYHDDRIKKFYDQFSCDAIAFWTSNFEIMRKRGLIKPIDPGVLAMEYLSFYIFAMMDYFVAHFDGEGSFLKASEKMLDEHMGFLVLSIKA